MVRVQPESTVPGLYSLPAHSASLSNRGRVLEGWQHGAPVPPSFVDTPGRWLCNGLKNLGTWEGLGVLPLLHLVEPEKQPAWAEEEW